MICSRIYLVLVAHWSSGQDVAFSVRRQGFDPPMGYYQRSSNTHIEGSLDYFE